MPLNTVQTMKRFQLTNTMDYRILLPYLTLGVFYFTKETMGQARLPVPCPPPFPDFEAIFARTLRLNPRFMDLKDQFQNQFNRPPNCSCSPALMGDIAGINQFRCERRTPILKVCPTTSTRLPTTPTRPSVEASSTRPLPPSPTVRYSAGKSPGTTAVSVDIPKPSTKGWGPRDPNIIDLAKSSTPYVTPSGVPSAKPVTTQDEGFTVVLISVGAGVLLLIFLIGFVLLCRKRLCAGSGVLGAHLRREKVQRLRSDCQPISAISRGDTFDDGYAASMISSAGSIKSTGSGEYAKRGYVTNGRKWRPEFDSDTSSEKYAADPKYILLREDSSASALSFSNHYHTLHTIEHPHALMMGGFGETSTDHTLPRTNKKKNKYANGDVAIDSIEDPMGVMPSYSSLKRIQSKDSLNSIEIYDRVSKPRGYRPNGYLTNNTGSPHSRRTTGGVDKASLDSIEKVDEAPIRPRAASDSRVKRGVVNLSYQAEDEDKKDESNWQKEVIDELKKESDEQAKYDSLVNEKNRALFQNGGKYIPPAGDSITPDTPSDIADSRESEISVAVVQPIKQEPKVRKFSKNDNSKRSAWSPTSKKQPPPVARKPSNGYKSDPKIKLSPAESNGQTVHDSSEVKPIPNGKLVNGTNVPVLVNGHGPVLNGHVTDIEPNDVGSVKKYVFDIQQKENVSKPSAHVQPQIKNYGDTRL